MNAGADYITKEKREALQAELADLKGPKRKELLQALEYAKSLGDLSENAEYHQTREEQGKMEARIQKIEQILETSLTVKGGGSDIIEIGSKVAVQKEGAQEEKNYVIVGSEEADMANGKISNRSPFGSALFGKKKGDKVSFETPNGTVNYKILSVS
jgi:transcription elongation factor GreA